tara:strand:- start:402 stop:1391 length:990 start_codon:yes stop_codon:yes gene_type:complete
MNKRVVCSVKRGQLEESQHEINCVVINQNNQTVFQSGNIHQDYCLRSTLKPFQSAASLKTGTDIKYNLSQKEIAITCASHHGEQQHINIVRNILKKINLTENDLECGFHVPLNKTNKAKLYSKEVKKSNIYNNCSGKHSGLLAMIKNLELPTKNYINHNHPIHQHINNYIINLAGVQPKSFATDGCSLPTPYFNLLTLSSMYMRLISAEPESTLSKILNSMVKFPEMVSGKKGFDSFFIKTLQGRAISKGGAEGMQAIAIKTGKNNYISLALKVSDGNHRGNYVSCIKILKHLGAISEKEHSALVNFIQTDQYNLNKLKIGELVCNILD